MNRKTQVVVATVIWVICLVGIATAVRMKGGLPHLSFPESAEAIAAETSQEPAADPSQATEPSAPSLTEVDPTEPVQLPTLPDDTRKTIAYQAVVFTGGSFESPAPPNDTPRLPEKTKQTPMTLRPPTQTLKDLHSTPGKAEETAVTPPIVPPPSALPPAPPPPAPTVAETATSAVPPPEPPSKVALDVPSADLLPPVRPESREPPMVTSESPTLERASAKPPVREDNSSPGVPMQALPPRPLSDASLALCLWSTVGKAKPRTHRSANKNDEPFVGTYFCTLDSQKGLVLPQKASEQMGLPRRVYLTPGPDDCLWLCNAAALERLTDKLDTDARRLYYAQTVRVAIDASGRITLPETLGPVGCLRQDLVLLGAGDHFELWDAQRLQRYVDQKAGKRAAKMEK